MADYWKSTPKYWCKHCSAYVTDTKLGRANHEATGKHQGAVRRALRDLHRDHDKQEREQEMARREVARLNGIVDGGDKSGKDGYAHKGRPTGRAPAPAPFAEPGAPPPREQLEQLAELGVSIPDQFRGELAMAGEWTVTATREIRDPSDKAAADARAVGVRKRQWDAENDRDDEDDRKTGAGGGGGAAREAEIDAAVQGLFKRPRQWGRDVRSTPSGDGGELDSLLSSALAPPVKREVKAEPTAKTEDDGVQHDTGAKTEDSVKEEDKAQGPDGQEQIKQEQPDNGPIAAVDVGDDNTAQPAPAPVRIKQEGDSGLALPPDEKDQEDQKDSATPAGAVLFKKRKAKTVRRK